MNEKELAVNEVVELSERMIAMAVEVMACAAMGEPCPYTRDEAAVLKEQFLREVNNLAGLGEAA